MFHVPRFRAPFASQLTIKFAPPQALTSRNRLRIVRSDPFVLCTAAAMRSRDERTTCRSTGRLHCLYRRHARIVLITSVHLHCMDAERGGGVAAQLPPHVVDTRPRNCQGVSRRLSLAARSVPPSWQEIRDVPFHPAAVVMAATASSGRPDTDPETGA